MSEQKAENESGKAGPGARERLLEAATDVFGRHGYDAATTRMIAGEAGVNIAAIPYYFQGKEGLYLAVVDHVVELITGHLAAIRREVELETFAAPDAGDRAAELLEKFLGRMLDFMIGSSQAPRAARIILREHLYPTAAYDRIFSGFMSASINTLAGLILRLSGGLSERNARIRAMALVGQILVFRIARESVVRALNMEGYSREETEEIRRIILDHTRSIVAALRRGPGDFPEQTT